MALHDTRDEADHTEEILVNDKIAWEFRIWHSAPNRQMEYFFWTSNEDLAKTSLEIKGSG